MPLTAAQCTQVFEIFGIPQSGSADVAAQLSSPFGAVCDSFDFSAVAGLLSARLAALSETQLARVSALLERWSALTSTSPLRITGSPGTGAGGVINDHPAERALIRSALSNLIGFAVQSGGIATEVSRSGDALSVSR